MTKNVNTPVASVFSNVATSDGVRKASGKTTETLPPTLHVDAQSLSGGDSIDQGKQQHARPTWVLSAHPATPGSNKTLAGRARDLIKDTDGAPKPLYDRWESLQDIGAKHPELFREPSAWRKPSLVEVSIEALRHAKTQQQHADAFVMVAGIIGKTQQAFNVDQGKSANGAAQKIFRDATRAALSLGAADRNTVLSLTLETGMQAQGHGALSAALNQVVTGHDVFATAHEAVNQQLLKVCGSPAKLKVALACADVAKFALCATLDLAVMALAKRVGIDVPFHKFARDNNVRDTVVQLGEEHLESSVHHAEDMVKLVALSRALQRDPTLKTLRELLEF